MSERPVDGVGVVTFCIRNLNHESKAPELLLHRRTDQCRDEKGRWDVGGGGMRHLEPPTETVWREIREEFSIPRESADPRLMAITHVIRGGRNPTHWISHLFLVEVDASVEVVSAEPHKHADLDWYPLYDDLDGLPGPLHSCFDPHYAILQQCTMGLPGSSYNSEDDGLSIPALSTLRAPMAAWVVSDGKYTHVEKL